MEERIQRKFNLKDSSEEREILNLIWSVLIIEKRMNQFLQSMLGKATNRGGEVGGGAICYDELYEDAPPERGTSFKL